jgi:hypothetical protein
MKKFISPSKKTIVTEMNATLPLLDNKCFAGVTKFGMQGMLIGPLIVAVAGVVWDGLVNGAGSGPLGLGSDRRGRVVH